jgi:hypothetical protein
VSTIRVGAIRFKLYPEDHEPRHVHAFVGQGEVIVDLRLDGTVALAHRGDGPIRGRVSRSDVRSVLASAVTAFEDLAGAWEMMHDEST